CDFWPQRFRLIQGTEVRLDAGDQLGIAARVQPRVGLAVIGLDWFIQGRRHAATFQLLAYALALMILGSRMTGCIEQPQGCTKGQAGRRNTVTRRNVQRGEDTLVALQLAQRITPHTLARVLEGTRALAQNYLAELFNMP